MIATADFLYRSEGSRECDTAAECDEQPQAHQSSAHLPKWVLQLRAKVDASREQSKALTSNLNSLKANTEALGDIVKESVKAFAKRDKKAEDMAQQRRKHKRYEDELTFLRLQAIPADVFPIVCSFLDFSSIACLDSASKVTRKVLIDANFWGDLSLRISPSSDVRRQAEQIRRKQDACPAEREAVRGMVQGYFLQLSRCIEFILEMKEQRGRLKHRDVRPHVYSRSDKEVSHYLPLFEKASMSNERIMSKSETFSSDFRSIALKALKSIVSMSSMVDDEMVQRKLAENSAITVLISLLANESEAMQQLSCSVLANMFAAEALRVVPGGQTGAEHTWMQAVEEYGRATRSMGRELAHQMRMCEGHRVLMGLLTSPSATVNLASGGSSSVQGTSNKAASRALANLFCPSMPILKEQVVGEDEYPVSSQLLQEWPRVRAWRFAHYSKAGSLKDTYLCYLCVSPDLYIQGRGSDDVGFFHLSGQSQKTIEGWTWLLHKTYVNKEIFQTNDDNMEHVADQIQSWLLQDGTSTVNASEQASAKARAHVSMTCYWRGADQDHHCEGMYGVSEVCGNEGKFYLDTLKGSIVRAVVVM